MDHYVTAKWNDQRSLKHMYNKILSQTDDYLSRIKYKYSGGDDNTGNPKSGNMNTVPDLYLSTLGPAYRWHSNLVPISRWMNERMNGCYSPMTCK